MKQLRPLAKLQQYLNLARKHAGDRFFYTVYIFFDMIACKVIFSSYLDDYFLYDYYKYNHFVIGDFVTYKRQAAFWKGFNARDTYDIFHNKFLFNERFSGFVTRKYMLAEASCEQAVRDFIREQGAVIVKPLDGFCGRDVFRLNADDHAQVERFVAMLGERSYSIEQVVSNAASLKRLNPDSLNTLRIVTCIDRAGKMHVINTVLRIGTTTSCVDNAHSGGVACSVNTDYGIVDSYACDREGRRYLVHPRSGEPLIGLQIPHWEKMHAYLERLVTVEPRARYVGWDIAVTDEGFELIEGNTEHGADVLQMCDKIGKYRQIRSLL